MKILIVAYYYPPLNAIASHRPYAWAKYWSRAGHDVRVLTTPKSPANGPLDLEIESEVAAHVRVEEVPFWPTGQGGGAAGGAGSTRGSRVRGRVKRVMRDLRRSVTGTLLDTRFFWVRPAVRHALNLYNDWPFDVVVSTYNPPATHLIGATLTKNLNIPWVADYRDLWLENPSEHSRGIFRLITKQIENSCVHHAAIITTASLPLAKTLQTRFNIPIFAFENGFDPDYSLDPFFPGKINSNRKKRLVYTGTLYPEYQDIKPLFEAIRSLIMYSKISDALEIIFYGPDSGFLLAEIEKYGLNQIVKYGGFISHRQSLDVQKNADALLFFDWNDPEIDGILTGKLFEYLFSGKPILCSGTAEPKAAGRLIEESGCGFNFGRNVERIAQTIHDILNDVAIPYQPQVEVLDKYTRKSSSLRMLAEIEKMVEARRA